MFVHLTIIEQFHESPLYYISRAIGSSRTIVRSMKNSKLQKHKYTKYHVQRSLSSTVRTQYDQQSKISLARCLSKFEKNFTSEVKLLARSQTENFKVSPRGKSPVETTGSRAYRIDSDTSESRRRRPFETSSPVTDRPTPIIPITRLKSARVSRQPKGETAH